MTQGLLKKKKDDGGGLSARKERKNLSADLGAGVKNGREPVTVGGLAGIKKS